jgi:hypothetical protein
MGKIMDGIRRKRGCVKEIEQIHKLEWKLKGNKMNGNLKAPIQLLIVLTSMLFSKIIYLIC